MPIHEIVEGRNQRIKDFYWQLWFGDDKAPQDLDVHDIFTGPEVTVSANDVEAFCAVVDNQQESLRLFALMRSRRGQGDMDYAIATGWQAIMKAISPSAIDGDLLKLVHLSNGFKMIPGSRPLKAGEVCCAATQVVPVVNGDSSGLVRVGRREQTAIFRLRSEVTSRTR